MFQTRLCKTDVKILFAKPTSAVDNIFTYPNFAAVCHLNGYLRSLCLKLQQSNKILLTPGHFFSRHHEVWVIRQAHDFGKCQSTCTRILVFYPIKCMV